jgi:nucleotide-binding universal stress UspA family protein
MSLKTILVHIDDSERCAHRLKVAIQLAPRRERASDRDLSRPGTDLPPPLLCSCRRLRRWRQRDIGEAQHAAERRFRSWRMAQASRVEWRAPAGRSCRRRWSTAAVPTCSYWDSEIPTTSHAVCRRIDIHDAPLVGSATVDRSAYRRCGDAGKNVLIAWDGGREAARAVADALPLLVHAKQVSVVTYTTDEDASPDVGLSTNALRAGCRDHGIAARVSGYEAAEGGVGESLLSLVADRGCDLIVMGGYGHTAPERGSFSEASRRRSSRA